MWDETTYRFIKFNGTTVEVYEWISNFIPHFMMDLVTYMLFNGAPGDAMWLRKYE